MAKRASTLSGASTGIFRGWTGKKARKRWGVSNLSNVCAVFLLAGAGGQPSYYITFLVGQVGQVGHPLVNPGVFWASNVCELGGRSDRGAGRAEAEMEDGPGYATDGAHGGGRAPCQRPHALSAPWGVNDS